MTAAHDVMLRALAPTDFGYVVTHLDDWWGGRPMTKLLPRLFFDHFHNTSLAAIDPEGVLMGFLVGFVPTRTTRAPESTASSSRAL